MKLLSIFLPVAALFLQATTGHAQTLFDQTLNTCLHPKSEWERWSSTKAGDFVEFSDETRLCLRFEAVNVGDHELSVQTKTYHHHPNHLGHIPGPSLNVIKHVFKLAERKSVKPTKVTDDTLKLGNREFSTKLEEFIYQKRTVKKFWFSEAAPFDGILQHQQYVLGKVGQTYVATRFKKGDTTFGKE
ncbi:hypothetical protein ETAA8_58880 [Anatilimnocola aggregata]|uniref:Uncharacterized protein n=1 Tax=Anatilimnocola aggregata TaxID=2528021 RepID=A0A517YKJ3_9BACT|nr:hypothetical protein [Anatilimnocola aggregata]QDU30740.1 hypothetical protein ETAA8_58880 [Anatilimnocola aggregata]